MSQHTSNLEFTQFKLDNFIIIFRNLFFNFLRIILLFLLGNLTDLIIILPKKLVTMDMYFVLNIYFKIDTYMELIDKYKLINSEYELISFI